MKVWDAVKKCRPGDLHPGNVYIGQRDFSKALATIGPMALDLTTFECRNWYEWFKDKDNPVMKKTLSGITAYRNGIVITYK